MREIVLDTETTGLDYKRGDRIIEVACVDPSRYTIYACVIQNVMRSHEHEHGPCPAT